MWKNLIRGFKITLFAVYFPLPKHFYELGDVLSTE